MLAPPQQERTYSLPTVRGRESRLTLPRGNGPGWASGAGLLAGAEEP